MTIEIRPITGDELTSFLRAEGMAFSGPPDERALEARRGYIDLERSIAAFDAGRIAGTASAYAFDLTVPESRTLPVAAVSWVSVLPTYRRQGILRALMRYQLDDMRARGVTLAILTASESAIYRRFGYGTATSALNFTLETRGVRLRANRAPEGRVRLVDHAEALTLLPPLYERVRLSRPGAISRSPTVWSWLLANPLLPADGAGPRYYVIYEAADGTVEGAAHYRIKAQWDDGVPASTLELRELLAATPEAHSGLWSYLLSMDLVATIRAISRPVDEPLRWILEDPRRIHVTACNDDLWLRLLDIPGALAGRDYAAHDRLVLDLSDSFCPENTGRYELRVEPGATECEQTERSADLSIDVSDLSAAYLGGVRFETLAQAGRVQEESAGAIRRADRLFRSAAEPWCATPF